MNLLVMLVITFASVVTAQGPLSSFPAHEPYLAPSVDSCASCMNSNSACVGNCFNTIAQTGNTGGNINCNSVCPTPDCTNECNSPSSAYPAAIPESAPQYSRLDYNVGYALLLVAAYVSILLI